MMSIYTLTATISHGAHLGHTIGIPTINMHPQTNDVPNELAYGVYSSIVTIDGQDFYGVTNVGVKPTVSSDNKVSLETHILDYNKNIYGKSATVRLLDFLRPEMKFSSVDELKSQMSHDIESVRKSIGATD